jgi:hypothetical protein
MISFRKIGALYCVVFSKEWMALIIKVFERALNCWSNPPQELIDILDQMKERQ